ncbi:YpoC family protein [Staphylococcus delphini]|uniref:YpoC family protein n=1 Tax=Staphylococcus delphini TaxID=53344 RepID=UPI00374E8330
MNHQEIIAKMSTLEEALDDYAKQRKIGRDASIPLLDDYYDALIRYFNVINEVEDYRLVAQESLRIVPFNIDERFAYIETRKHHYMGYQQMKTLKSELVKMYAAYRARHRLS